MQQIAKFYYCALHYYSLYKTFSKSEQVIRLNQKTATIATDDDRQWNVSPELLKKFE
jgi:hypothetical protein